MSRAVRSRLPGFEAGIPSPLRETLGAEAASGPLITLPGAPPGPANVTTPIVADGAYTVTAGQYVYGVNLSYLFESDFGFLGPLINNGTIWSVVGRSDATFNTFVRYNRARDIQNNGVMVLETTSGVARTVGFSETGLTNTGSIYVLSHNANYAALLESSLGGYFTNSGLIAVQALNSSAYGYVLYNGGAVLNQAGGSILVEGLAPIGIQMYGDGAVSSDGDPTRIVNDGRIEVRSLGDGPSIGAMLAHNFRPIEVINSGLFKADYAFVSSFSATTAQPNVEHITNTATGRIEGHFLLDRGDDVVTNDGDIVGHIFMEEGNDRVDTRNGTIEGIIDLGWGADTFLGSALGDQVAGDDGADRIEGFGGADLLMGGSGDDVLIGGAGADGLYGEFGRDRIVTVGADDASGGAGDDTLEAGDFGFRRVDGGAGFDTLVLPGGARALDLAAVLQGGAVSDIEHLVLGGGKTLSIRGEDIVALTGSETTLRVTTGAGDALNLVGAWTAGPDQQIDGVTWRAWSQGGRTVLVAGDGAVATGGAATGGGLDAPVGSAPVPGEAGGLDFTSNVLVLESYELHQSVTISEEQTWLSASGGPVLISYSGVTLTIDGALVSYRESAADGVGLLSVIGGRSNIDSIVNNGLILIENHATEAGHRGAVGIQLSTFTEIHNFGTIDMYCAAGALFGLELGQIWNDGDIFFEVGAGTALGIRLIVGGAFENTGRIMIHVGEAGPLDFGFAMNYAVGVVVNAGTHNNSGEIVATSNIPDGATALWYELGDDATLNNSGLIAGDTAIRVHDGYGPGALHLINSGEVRGRIEMDYGADQIDNTGLIDGAVLLGRGNDVFDGRGGVQIGLIDGQEGDDTLWGGAGADTFSGGEGADAIHGGDGVDRAVFTGDRAAYSISTVDGVTTISGGSDGADTLTGIEQLMFADGLHDLTGAPIANPITGTAAADFITGTGATDAITAGAGNDTISAGAGDDLITAGTGNDRIDGGAGQDVLIVSGDVSGYRLLMDGDNFILKGADGRDSLTGVESIRFGDGRVLELNRMYWTGQASADGAIPVELLSGSGDEPLVLPGSVDDPGGKANEGPEILPALTGGKSDDAFVLPLLPYNQPLVLPGVGADKFAGEPLVLPGDGQAGRYFLGLVAHLPPTSDWMITLDPDGGLMGAPRPWGDDGL
ncbi:calcium-binding protein [Brevundimonas sp.]|uniref:calcium-binding protein n=1 Tax=Brevundimonas sp. TaxID=1871086 RepID=UPI002D393B35|nr:calcium-binding protein [Brevundimonas sp.]HYD27318.1 calcium-binding protein [Brevundimonas sp.]